LAHVVQDEQLRQEKQVAEGEAEQSNNLSKKSKKKAVILKIINTKYFIL
jgi:hypothetical protein